MASQEDYVPFSARKGWEDIAPIPQDDGPNPICRIAYTPQYIETMNYFRAILHKDERSERALALSAEVIQMNPANYTAWYFRRIVLDALGSDLRKELEFVSQVGEANPKNYQIWYHRKSCVSKLQDFSVELQYTADQIEEDNKNYHAWAYRQWVVEQTNGWQEELKFIDDLLAEDFRNNSAWNQRYFVISRGGKQKKIENQIRDQEVQYAFNWIKKAPNNQSPWTYMKGLFIEDRYSDSLMHELEELAKTKYFTCPHVFSLLIDIYQQQNTKESLVKGVEFCVSLGNSLDTLHKKYWNYKKENLEKSLSLLQ